MRRFRFLCALRFFSRKRCPLYGAKLPKARVIHAAFEEPSALGEIREGFGGGGFQRDS
ncbi:hypothetical protein RchiOBHm_Chr1g0372391 [Rosa chinensis]|uniref:Uncharacterized protein n=1 Tax=Rosa chinensis TaxID=74649 RepID=A0A2P6SLR7_ROSCH|nr:hypothetical protein RchiOBHm_Chr1g0372391 [Rosa chinensis]